MNSDIHCQLAEEMLSQNKLLDLQLESWNKNQYIYVVCTCVMFYFENINMGPHLTNGDHHST